MCLYTITNVVVERKHKNLLQIAKSLMFQANLAKKIWGDSILMASFIINRLPSSILNWKASFELLTKTSPDYDMLKVFGCFYYVTNINPHKDNFGPEAFKCDFIMYRLGMRVQSLWHQESYGLYIQGCNFSWICFFLSGCNHPFRWQSPWHRYISFCDGYENSLMIWI